MKIRSYYVNIRKRWSMIPRAWNEFFGNLEFDYRNMKFEIDSHAINTNETTLQTEMEDIIIKFKRS